VNIVVAEDIEKREVLRSVEIEEWVGVETEERESRGELRLVSSM
jgi:hypothetical protein